MDPIIERLGNRLKPLMDEISFKWDDRALDSQDQFMKIGTHNARQYEKFATMNPECQERIWNLFSNMLAIALQKLALDQCGNTEGESIRAALYDRYRVTASQEYWDRITRLAKNYFLGLGLTEQQYQPIQEYFDTFPTAMIDYCINLIKPWRFLPATKAQSIAMALADMMKEAA